MSIELERAARGAAQRKVAAGVEPRDPIDAGLHFQHRQVTPLRLIVAVVLAALVLVGLVLSYLYTVPPAHILIVALVLCWLVGWGVQKRKKGKE
jgi:Flp pilus assembly protein TadB